MIILIILIIVLLLSLSLINKTFKKKDNILEDVKLQENTIKNDGFALMLQKEDGTYQESTSSIFPTDMKFNSELSGCIDLNGNKIDNALSYDNNSKLVTVQTNKTSYCYVYFDIDNSLNSKILNSSDLWDMTETIGIEVMDVQEYRYVGIEPNNYICFGTSNKETCIGDTDKYMYRIIGIFEDEAENKHAKLIKKEALNTAYAWNSTNTDINWNESDLFKGLNGSYFLTSSEYSYMQNSDWTNKISTWDYTMTNTKAEESGGLSYDTTSVQKIYLHELNRNGKTSNVGEWKIQKAKVGLMYASDYALSLGSTSLNYTSSSNYSVMKTGWMHLLNNDVNDPVGYEWTMSRFGTSNAWFVVSTGYVAHITMEYAIAARPVFYLESDVEISGGTGTISDPYLLAE